MTANPAPENQSAAASTQDVRGSGLSVASGSASEDIFNSEQYQKFVDSMTHHCRCTGQPRPCDGVLAGGICDDWQEDPRDEEETPGERYDREVYGDEWHTPMSL